MAARQKSRARRPNTPASAQGPDLPEVPIPGQFAEWLNALIRGEKELPNSAGERHHYTPEFVLRKFRSPQKKLFQLDKRDGACEEIKPKDAAWEPRLYSVESTDGAHDGIIEGFFSLAETFAAGSLRRLLSPAVEFTEEDRGNLAFLIAAQEQRVPGYLREWGENLGHMATVLAVTEFASHAEAGRRRRRALEAARALTEGGVTIEPTQENLLQTVLQGIGSTVAIVYQLPWTLMRAKQGMFVCSDRPLTQQPNGERRLLSYEVIESNSDARRAIAPRKVSATRDQEQRAPDLVNVDPRSIRRQDR